MMESRLTDRRIGILGGSFDPLHLGHISIARNAARHLALTEVIFVPAAQPPHKQHVQLAEGSHRLAMLEQALADEEGFTVSDTELRREGLSFTIDTVRSLRKDFSGAELYLIVGSDTLLDLHTWYRVEELLSLCSLVTVVRPGAASHKEIKQKISFPEPYKSDLLKHFIEASPTDISSTEIRQRIAAGESITKLVPEAVETYIKRNSLYQD